MKKILLCFSFAAFLLSCNSNQEKTTATTSTADSTTKSTVDLPYKATYSSSWSADISDADLKMVLTTYKDWADGNMSNLAAMFADSVDVDLSSGDHFRLPKDSLIKMFGHYRDSLSSVKIDMGGWNKMHSTDKKDDFIVTWYDETDTYKIGKVDSASYHDINQVKDGKIVWYAQYKRPKK
jgi:hypothetical protein